MDPDVASQSTSPGWTLGSWAEYYNTPEAQREKIRNVISLEVTGTALAEQITPPRLVREIDWVEHMWPSTKKTKGQFPASQVMADQHNVELSSIHPSTDETLPYPSTNVEIEHPQLPLPDTSRGAYLVLVGFTLIQAPIWGKLVAYVFTII